jgi:hypothetical protein
LNGAAEKEVKTAEDFERILAVGMLSILTTVRSVTHARNMVQASGRKDVQLRQ